MKSKKLKTLAMLVSGIVAVSSFTAAFTAMADNAADPAWAGTEADGMTTDKVGGNAVDGINSTEALMNGDFEKGLKYWACNSWHSTSGNPALSSDVTSLTASHVGSVKTEANGNKYFQFDGKVRYTFNGLMPNHLSVPASRLNVGDTVVMVMDYKAVNADDAKFVQLKITERNAGGRALTQENVSEATVLKAASATNGWTTIATKKSNTVAAPNTGSYVGDAWAHNAGDYCLEVYIQVHNGREKGQKSELCIDNVRIAKLTADGKYIDLSTNEEIVITPDTPSGGGVSGGESGGESGGSTPTPAGDPEWAGTEADGITSLTQGESSTDSFAPVDGFANGNFEKGLKYWASTAKFNLNEHKDNPVTSLKASETGSIKTEANGNKYFQFDGKSRQTYCGIKTAKISIPASKINVGDKIAVMFDWKANADGDDVQVKAEQRYIDGAGASTNTMASKCEVLKKATASDPWNTVATKPQGAVGKTIATAAENKSVRDGDYVFMITASIPGGSVSTAAIDNVRLVKVTSDNKYIDLNTGSEVVIPTGSNGSGNGGSNGSGTGTGSATGKSNRTGEDVTALACLLLLGAAGTFGFVKAAKIKSRQ